MADFYTKTMIYNPRNDRQYMSFNMKAYFRNMLYQELQQLLEEEHMHSLSLSENTNREADFVDQGSSEELRFNCGVYQEHEMHLRHDIESALRRMADGTYGYCIATGNPIGVERLIAAPSAKYCLQVQMEKEGYRARQWA